MASILHHLLASEPACEPVGDVAAFLRGFEARRAQFADPIELALASGFVADRMAWAFAGGYQAALESLFGRGGLSALCATEQAGAHPRNIATRLEREGARFRLRGEKRMVTFGPAARVLYVVASRGERDDGQKDLVVVRLPSERKGVTMHPLDPLPFVPEVPHGRVTLDATLEPEEILAGDGYRDYLKPFRTVEDIHVGAATTGFFVGLVRRSGGTERELEGLSAHAVTLRALAREPSDDAAVQVALAGALGRFSELISAFDLGRLDEASRQRWLRDRPLLTVAANVRERRLSRAWERLSVRS
jgi:acyl-CoA dehydrogenase